MIKYMKSRCQLRCQVLAFFALLFTPGFAVPYAHAEVAPEKDGGFKPNIVMVDADLRAGINLDGSWHYLIDPYKKWLPAFYNKEAVATKGPGADVDVSAIETADPSALLEFDLGSAPTGEVPSSWVSYDPDLRNYTGLTWYQKRFDADVIHVGKGGRAFLHFDAANYHAVVYLNGHKVGEHYGGFTPFTFEVTDLLRDKDNNLVVGVDATRTLDTVPQIMTDWETYGGLTRDVKLVSTPATYIDDAFIRLTRDGRIEAELTLNGDDRAQQKVTVNIDGLKLMLTGITDDKGVASFSARAPRDLKLWSPDSPVLYDVTFQTGSDSITDKIGFRTVEVRGDKILLNGKPIFLRGITMHEEELGPNPSRRITEAASRALLSEIKTELHGNFVRLAHYPHSEITTRLADQMGLLVWSEIPVYWSVNFSNPDTLHAAQAMLAENILRDRNRASIIIWSVGNETPISEARNHFLGTLAQEARDLDGTRLISAALNTATVTGPTDISIKDPLAASLDVIGINTYGGWYGNTSLAEVMQTRWHSDYDKPVIFSEFGAGAKFGYRDPEKQHRFSEDYQASYYKATLAMADNVPFLAGMSPWILKDFRSPLRQNAFQQGWNRKGLIDENGNHKMAFDVLADYYQAKSRLLSR